MTPTVPDDIASSPEAATQRRSSSHATSSYAALAIVAAIAIAVWAFFTLWHLLPKRREPSESARKSMRGGAVDAASLNAPDTPSAP